MAVGSHNILSKCDRALVSFLLTEAGQLIADTLPAKLSLDKPIPCTVCFSERATLLDGCEYAAVYEVMASVLVKTMPAVDAGESAEGVKNTSEERVSAVFDAFFLNVVNDASAGDHLGFLITSAARELGDDDMQEFTVQNAEVLGVEAGFDAKGTAWIDTINLKLIVCPKNVS